MVRSKQGLEKKIERRIQRGDEPEAIARELDTGLVNVLSVAHNIQQSVQNGPLADYINECRKYGVIPLDIARSLGIDVQAPVNVPIETSSANGHSTPTEPYVPGQGYRKEAPSLGGLLEGEEDPTYLRSKSDPYALESNRITMFGIISADHRELEKLLPLFRAKNYAAILDPKGEPDNSRFKGKESEKEAAAKLFHIASRISDRAEGYIAGLASSPSLLRHFQEQLGEIKESADDFLAEVGSYLGIPPKKPKVPV